MGRRFESYWGHPARGYCFFMQEVSRSRPMTDRFATESFRCGCCRKVKRKRVGTAPVRCGDCSALISSMRMWNRSPDELLDALAKAERRVMVIKHMIQVVEN